MDPYTIIFATLAVVSCFCLYSVLGQRTGSERPIRVSAFTYRLSMIAFGLGAVNYVAYEANWYAAIEARVSLLTTASDPARLVHGNTFILGTFLAMALLLGAALVLSFRQWEEWKAKTTNPGFLRQKPQWVDPGIEREFNNVFITASKEGKEALIKRWIDRKNCDRNEAMRLAIEEVRRDIR